MNPVKLRYTLSVESLSDVPNPATQGKKNRLKFLAADRSKMGWHAERGLRMNVGGPNRGSFFFLDQEPAVGVGDVHSSYDQ